MKIKLLYSWLAMMLFAVSITAQVQVGDGTSTGQAIPIEPFYGFTYSQSVYLSSEINASGDITGIQFEYNGNSTLVDSDEIVIYMGESSRTEFTSDSDWEPVANLTEVFNGTITAMGAGTSEWINITFATPFTYSGNMNLIVAVDENAASFDGNADEFFSEPTSTTRSMAYRSDSVNPDPASPPAIGFNGGLRDFIPNTIFNGIQQTCPVATAPSATVTGDTTADFSWTASTGETGGYSWEVVTSGSPAGTNVADSGTTATGVTMASASGLTPSTLYDFIVSVNCPMGETSAFTAPVTFRTPGPGDDCTAAIPIALVADCDAPGVVPERLDLASRIDIGSFSCDSSGTNTGAFYEFTTGTVPTITMNTSIDLEYEITDSCGGVVIACGSTDATGLNIVTGLAANTNYKLAFWVDGTSTDIAEICLQTGPTCFIPTGASAANITDTTADLSFTTDNGNTNPEVQFEVVPVGTMPSGTPNFPTTGSTSMNPFQVQGLSPGTAYEFYVREVCSPTDSSGFSGPFTFRTSGPGDDCATALPLTVNADCSDPGAVSYDLDLANAGDLGSIAGCDTGGVNTGLWFEFTTGATVGTITLNTTEDLKYQILDVCAGTEVECDETTGGTGQIITNLLTSTNYKIAMWVDGTSTDVVFICIEEGPVCLDPTGLDVLSVTDTTAELTWMATGTNNVDYDVVVVAQGDPVTGPVVATATNTGIPASISGLTEQTEYDFFVRANCGGGELSQYVAGPTFMTACGPIAAPFLEDVEAFATTQGLTNENCWSDVSATAYDWAVEDGSTTSSATGPDGPFMGTRYFYVEASNGSNGDTATLWSPQVDLSALAAPALSFRYHMYGAFITSLDVNISIDGGATFTTTPIFQLVGPQQFDELDPWLEAIVDLSAYANETVIVSFSNTKGPGPGNTYESDVSLDNISFDEAPPCITPSGLAVSNEMYDEVTMLSSADFIWNSNDPAQTLWDLDIVPLGGTPSPTAPSHPGQTATTVTLDDLAPGTRFTAYVRADCGATDGQSFYSAGADFRTPGLGDSCALPVDANLETVCDASTQIVIDFTNAVDLGTDFASCAGNGTNLGVWYDFSLGRGDTSIEISTGESLSYALFEYARNSACVNGTELRCGTTSDTDTIEVGNLESRSEYRIVFWDETESLTTATVCLLEGPSCLQPFDLVVDNINTTTADFSWTPGEDTQTAFDVIVFNGGDDPLVDTPFIPETRVTMPTFNATGLVSGNSYDFYVRADCGDATTPDLTEYVGPVTITTPLQGETCIASFNVPVVADCSTATPFSFDLSNAFNLNAVASCDATGTNPGLWIDFVAPSVGSVTVSMSESMEYALFDSCGGNELACGSSANTTGLLLGLTPGETYRMALWTDSSSTATTDICVESGPDCPPVTGLDTAGITDTTATITWIGSNPAQTTFDIEWGPVGFTPTGTPTEDNVGNPFTLTMLSPETTYDVYVRTDCGTELSDYAGPLTFTTPCSAFVAPYFTNFEDFTPTTAFDEENCWVDTSSTIYDWAISDDDTTSGATGPDAAFSGTNFLYVEASDGPSGSIANIFTPTIDISALTNPELSFYYHMYGSAITYLDVAVSTDNGSTYTSVVNLVGEQQADNDSDWLEQRVDLTPYAGGTVIFRLQSEKFTGASVFNGDVAIDDFSVGEVITCDAPTGITFDNISGTTVDVFWTEGSAGQTNFDLQYGIAPFAFDENNAPTESVSTLPTMAMPLQLNGLTGSSTYEFYIRADCGGTDGVSRYVGPFTFTTACVAITPDYIENFSSYIPQCWEEATGGDETTGPTSLGANPWIGDGFANDGFSGSARFEIWFSQQGWLLSPEFDLSGGGYEVNFDVAGTVWNNTNPMDMSAGDKVVFVMTEDGVNWTEIRRWEDGSEPSVTGDNINFNLTSTGTNVQFGFYAEADSTGDHNFYVDNFAVRTPPSCNAPTGLVQNAIFDSSVNVSFQSNNPASSGSFEYALTAPGAGVPTAASAAWTDATAIGMDSPMITYTIGDGTAGNPTLSPNTEYDLYVREVCAPGDESSWTTNPLNFTTLCSSFTPLYLEDFSTYVPDCWDEATGGDETTGPITFGTSLWTNDGFANNSFTGAAKFNIYTTNRSGWLVSPSFDLSAGGYELTMDVASTDFADTFFTPWDSDDKVELVYTEDGINWLPLNTWDENNQPSETGENYVETLASTASDVRFAFYATSGPTSNGADTDFFIDNFRIRTIPACQEVQNITIDATTSTSVTVSWTDPNIPATTDWEVVILPSGSPAPAVGTTNTMTNSYTEGALDVGTSYDIYIRANCNSVFTGPTTFVTDCAVISSFPRTAVFSSNTPNPNCWSQADAGDQVSGPSSLGTSSWRTSDAEYIDASSNLVQANAINLYSNFVSDWLLTAEYDMSGITNGVLTVEVAVTDWGLTSADPTGMSGTDDTVQLLVTEDSGNTWSELVQWSAANNNAPDADGDVSTYDLTAYTGIVQFAFLAKDNTDDTSDYDFNVGRFTVDGTASSNDLTLDTSFGLYPNPVAGDALNINVTNGTSSDYQITIVNTLGQVVQTRKFNNVSNLITVDNLSDLTAGMYFIQLSDGVRNESLKFIKQ
ncbi:MAG: choice-of-anchor J domain-containing protein [Nonlabens sp.]